MDYLVRAEHREAADLSSKQALIDAATRHQIYMLRYAGGVEKEMIDQLDRIIAEATRRLEEEAFTAYSIARQQQIIAELRSVVNELYQSLQDDMVQQALDFGLHEADFTQRMLERSVAGTMATPSAETIHAAIYASSITLAPGGQMAICEALRQFSKAGSERIVQTVKDGVILGETNDQIVRKLRGLGVENRQYARAMTRTIVNHVVNVSRGTVLSENAELFEGYEWVSTLDSRTTFICASRDGNIYAINDPYAPKPPAHWNCRSTIIPKVKPQYDLAAKAQGSRPSRGAGGTSQVGANTTYEGWLKRQPAAFQDEILGPTRGRLFRNGGLSMERFVDASGKTYTLDQLRTLEAQAFAEANI